MKNLGFLGYPAYAIAADGRVYSLKSKRYLKSSVSSTSGACRVNLRENGEVKTTEIHRLVALAFLPNPEGYLVVNHLDGDRTNNRSSNLEWCTHERNSVHAVQEGLSPVRSLNDEDAHTIFQMMEEGYTNKDISDLLGTPYAVIAKMRQGANYRDIWEQYRIPTRKHTLSVYKAEKIKKMLNSGCFVETICQELNVGRARVKDIRDGKIFTSI